MDQHVQSQIESKHKNVWAPFFLGLSLVCALALPSKGRADEQSPGAVAEVSLTPAGDFKAKFDSVKGTATLSGTSVSADKLVIQASTIKTGLTMRDKHAREKYMEIEKFPDITITDAKGENGKGTAKLNFHGIEKPVHGTYKTDAKFLHAEFPIKLSDFGITGIKYMGVGVDDDVKIIATVPLKQ